jgi:hypothetical protein
LLTDKRIPDTVGRQLDIVGRDDYLFEFEQEVKEDVLMIGNISLDEIKVGVSYYYCYQAMIIECYGSTLGFIWFFIRSYSA